MKPAMLVFALRPDATSLWLPPEVASRAGVLHGAALTPTQMAHPAVVELLAARAVNEGGGVREISLLSLERTSGLAEAGDNRRGVIAEV